MYAVRGGFLIRPLVIAMILGASGAVLSSLEEAIPGIRAWIPSTLFPSHEDPGVAQVILSSIATYHDRRVDRVRDPADDAHARIDAILAAHPDQLCPGPHHTGNARHIPGDVCLLHGRIARRTRTPASLRTDRDRDRGDGARAGLCGMAYLLHQPHLPLDQCQPIVDRIARETELVIDEYMPYPRGPFQLPDRSEASSAEHGEPVFNR
jgi:hypothetical protein